jgi:hypothetical protein
MDIRNNKPVTVTFSDGTVKQIIFSSFNVSPEGAVSLQGHLSDLAIEQVVETPIEAPAEPTLPEDRPYLRSYLFKSGLIRFLHEGCMHTAAITHCTDKAWRVINKELGVAWLPKNVIRWSEIAQQFCVIDETYELDFTFDVKQGMDEYPSLFDPEDLVVNELD